MHRPKESAIVQPQRCMSRRDRDFPADLKKCAIDCQLARTLMNDFILASVWELDAPRAVVFTPIALYGVATTSTRDSPAAGKLSERKVSARFPLSRIRLYCPSAV